MNDFKKHIEHLEQYLKQYLIPKDKWTAVEKAVYGPTDLFGIPLKKANELQLNALQYTFHHHYKNNQTYRQFCKLHNVQPKHIKKTDDLTKIPLLPSSFFKSYPDGRDFARWISSIFTGNIPKISIDTKIPSYDKIIDAYNTKGLRIFFSSGTSGRHTFIPRDNRTFCLNQYSLAKTVVAMSYPTWQYDSYAYTLMPNPLKTNLWAAANLKVYGEVVKHMQYTIDRKITTEELRRLMSPSAGTGIKEKIVKKIAKRISEKSIDKIVSWVNKHQHDQSISLIGAPFILYDVSQKMLETGETVDFGERGFLATGGGWKTHQDKKIEPELFRKEMEKSLGIPSHKILDTYGMVEINGWNIQCPEGHYFHTTHSYLKPMVVDDEFNVKDYGEWGRFAFMDASALSYPGFVVTDDVVRLRKQCPICDRPGPVIEPKIKRAKGSEMRGCAEEVRQMMSSDAF